MVEHTKVTTIKSLVQCCLCGESELIKYGKYKKNQYYLCNSCGAKFSEVETYPLIENPEIVMEWEKAVA